MERHPKDPVISIEVNKLYMIVIGVLFTSFATIMTGIGGWSLVTLIEYKSTMPIVLQQIDVMQKGIDFRTSDRWTRSEETADNKVKGIKDNRQDERLDDHKSRIEVLESIHNTQSSLSIPLNSDTEERHYPVLLSKDGH